MRVSVKRSSKTVLIANPERQSGPGGEMDAPLDFRQIPKRDLSFRRTRECAIHLPDEVPKARAVRARLLLGGTVLSLPTAVLIPRLRCRQQKRTPFFRNHRRRSVPRLWRRISRRERDRRRFALGWPLCGPCHCSAWVRSLGKQRCEARRKPKARVKPYIIDAKMPMQVSPSASWARHFV